MHIPFSDDEVLLPTVTDEALRRPSPTGDSAPDQQAEAERRFDHMSIECLRILQPRWLQRRNPDKAIGWIASLDAQMHDQSFELGISRAGRLCMLHGLLLRHQARQLRRTERYCRAAAKLREAQAKHAQAGAHWHSKDVALLEVDRILASDNALYQMQATRIELSVLNHHERATIKKTLRAILGNGSQLISNRAQRYAKATTLLGNIVPYRSEYSRNRFAS